VNSSTSNSERITPQSARFIVRFAWVAGAFLLFTMAVNYFVDPHYRFGTNRIGVYISSEREYKATAVQIYPHDGLIVGNSKPSIIDPLKIDNIRFFNAGFASAKPEEIYAFLQRYAHDQKVVVLALDFGMFNEGAAPIRTDPFERPFFSDACRYLLSLTSFQYAMEGLFRKVAGQGVTILPTGQSNPEPYLKKDKLFTEEHYEPALRLLREDTFNNFDYSETRIGYIEKIRDLLKERGIQLIVFISPENDAVLDLIHSLPAGDDFARWKVDLNRIVPNVIDLSDDPAWQAHKNYFLHDPYHYFPEAGTRIMQDHILPAIETH